MNSKPNLPQRIILLGSATWLFILLNRITEAFLRYGRYNSSLDYKWNLIKSGSGFPLTGYTLGILIATLFLLAALHRTGNPSWLPSSRRKANAKQAPGEPHEK